jgi:hypothetical protein
MRILAIGDIVGKPGRNAVKEILPRLYHEYSLNMVIGNGENAAAGLGLTPATAEELLDAGIDVITSGNHIWAHKEIIPYLDGSFPILRPLNYPAAAPGHGYFFKDNILVVNLMGRTFMGSLDCPFHTIDELLAKFENRAKVIIVDFHAEATSEKVAMGRYLNGRVSAVLGTHTHVGTIDAQILSAGTAYVTDIGMVGPANSIIGNDVNSVLHRFLTQMPTRLSMGKGKVIFNAILVEVDEGNGKAINIQRIQEEVG